MGWLRLRFLQRRLSKGKAEEREAAARELGCLGDIRAVPALQIALKDKLGVVRRAAIKALEQLGDPELSSLLITSLGGWDQDARRDAASALKRLGGLRRIEELLQSPDSYARAKGARLLKEYGDRSNVPALLLALWDEELSVVAVVVDALVELGGSDVIKPLTEPLCPCEAHCCAESQTHPAIAAPTH